jgi:protein-disulfide isomerase
MARCCGSFGTSSPTAGDPILGHMSTFTTAARWRAVAMFSAIFGAGVSTYLLVEYTTGQAGICLTGSGCDVVRNSAFAFPLGIPMPAFGLAYDLVAAGLVFGTLANRPFFGISPVRALLGLACIGAAVSVALTGVEAFVIGAFCSWCLTQAVAGWLLLAATVGLARSGGEPGEARSRRARQQLERERAAEGSRIRRVTLVSGSLTAALFAGLLLAGAGSGSTAVESPGPGATVTTTGSPQLGNGPVTVVEFADFECPACATMAPILHQLASTNEITLVARYFPLRQIHPNAMASARAAAAADLQGGYWPMAERLYAAQSAWEGLSGGAVDAYFATLAGDLGLDVSRWKADYGSSASLEAVNRDLAAAQGLNLPGTPSIFLDGSYYTGPLSLGGLQAAIARATPGS